MSKKLRTPIIMPRKQGGTFYTFSSAMEDIGLNINESGWPEDLPNPVSLGELTGKSYDIHEELEAFYKEFCRHAQMLSSEDGRKYLCENFDENVFRLPEAL